MKLIKSLIISLFVIVTSASAYAQSGMAKLTLLEDYYQIKNALVKGESATAANAANSFLSNLKKIKTDQLAAKERQVFAKNQSQLSSMLEQVSTTDDLAKQRLLFQSISEVMFEIARVVKHSQPIYVDYCPMKKAYWLSESTSIRNPYFGSTMLTCGSLQETIQ